MTSNTLRKWFTWPLITVAYGLALFITVSSFWPFKTATIQSPVKILGSKVFYPGDTVNIRLSYCKYREQEVIIDRQMVNGFIQALPSVKSNLPTGCHEIDGRGFIIPLETQPGIYHVHFVANYVINPWRTIGVLFETENFTVINRPN